LGAKSADDHWRNDSTSEFVIARIRRNAW